MHVNTVIDSELIPIKIVRSCWSILFILTETGLEQSKVFNKDQPAGQEICFCKGINRKLLQDSRWWQVMWVYSLSRPVKSNLHLLSLFLCNNRKQWPNPDSLIWRPTAGCPCFSRARDPSGEPQTQGWCSKEVDVSSYFRITIGLWIHNRKQINVHISSNCICGTDFWRVTVIEVFTLGYSTWNVLTLKGFCVLRIINTENF